MKILITMCGLVLLAGCGQANQSQDPAQTISDIELDETVVFFNTSGWLDETTQEWHLPIHGWIYEPEDSSVRKAAFEQVLKSKYDLVVSAETQDNFSRRLNLLIADNERDKEIVVNIAGRQVPMAASAANGHFESTIVLPAAEVAKFAKDDLITFSMPKSANDTREFSGAVKLVTPNGVSVISDIDDTVKISNVGDHRSLLEQTFFLDFAAAPGMADQYDVWLQEGVAFHYVSSSPWQLYSPLREFLQHAGFPWATFSLKAIRFRDETLLDLFKEGTETKPAAIRRILDRYPMRQFILVGDSGEQDPEVYAALMRDRPDQIQRVYIRNVTAEDSANDRFSTVFNGLDEDRWLLFQHASEISSQSQQASEQ